MANFEPCFEKVLALEGGYKLHEVRGDIGGLTYAGIARNMWPEWEGWPQIEAGVFDAELTGMVFSFFKENFWDRIMGDDIGSQIVAYHIYDFAVNAGVKTSVRMCQEIIGVTKDGMFGPKTFRALNDFIQGEKDERIFVLDFSLLKVFRYKDICMSDDRRPMDRIESNQKFLCGWINRVQIGME